MEVQLLSGVFLPKMPYFVGANSVGYLRANARVPTVYLPRLRLGLGHFSLKTQPVSKNREPGLQENSVRNFTGRQLLSGVFLRINGGRDACLYPGNNFPNLVYFAVTWALRTCRAARGPGDVRYGPTFPVKLG